MIPFHDYELLTLLEKKRRQVQMRIQTMSNEEIMSNDLDILAENIFQEFYIMPVVIFEEDCSKRKIYQGSIRKIIDPYLGKTRNENYIYVDGIDLNPKS